MTQLTFTGLGYVDHAEYRKQVIITGGLQAGHIGSSNKEAMSVRDV